jgi:hypothetical protein
MSWMNMTETRVIENTCEHCGRSFTRETTLLKHLCEQKLRWLDQDKKTNRIAYNLWKTYYQKHHPNKRNLEYKDFAKNSYYNAFIKFSTYCISISAVNVDAFFNYLLQHRVPIDSWSSDTYYNKYLIEYLRVENNIDAVKRSIENLLDVVNEQNIRINDAFTFLNPNKLCYMIANGKISPWILYNSKTGISFLSQLNDDQTRLVFDYIDPEKWNIKFKREQSQVNEVKDILSKIPL